MEILIYIFIILRELVSISLKTLGLIVIIRACIKYCKEEKVNDRRKQV